MANSGEVERVREEGGWNVLEQSERTAPKGEKVWETGRGTKKILTRNDKEKGAESGKSLESKGGSG